MKIEDNHYTYRIETKDSNGGSLDFIDIDTVEPLRCAYDVQDELNLETNEHIKRVEEIVLDANSTEFWYVDEVRTSDTHLVCYFEEVELMASKDHPMVDTDRSLFEYGKINSNEHQNTNFICTHVMDNGVSRIYMSIDKETFGFATFNNETIKHFISNNPVTVWYALRYEIIIPRSMSKGHLLTLSGQTDITLTTTSEQAKLPIMKFNIGDTQYTLDNNPIHINNTQEGTQIRNIVLEGNTPINYARGNGVNTTEQVSNTRYDFEPFYDGQATIQGTVEGGYVSAKLYGDTMVNIAKPYGETPLLTATSESALCDDLLGMNEEGIVLADGEITEGRIYGDSLVNMLESCSYAETQNGSSTLDGEYAEITSITDEYKLATILVRLNTSTLKASTTYYIKYLHGQGEKISEQISDSLLRDTQNRFNYEYGLDYTWDYENQIFTLTPSQDTNIIAIYIRQPLNSKVRVSNCVYVTDDLEKAKSYNIKDGFNGIGSVVNPTVTFNGIFKYGRLYSEDGNVDSSMSEMHTELLSCPTSPFNFYSNNSWNKVVFYDENKVFIKSQQTGDTMGVALEVVDIPINAKYVRFGFFICNGLKGLTIKYTDGTDVYPNLQLATFPYTLNKLPNGVADYIDVVNKVHVQRVGVLHCGELEDNKSWAFYNETPLADGTPRVVCYYPFAYMTNPPKRSSVQLGLSDKLIPRGLITEHLSIYDASEMILVTILNLSDNTTNGFNQWMIENNPTVLYELATPIYTPLTEEEIAQLPLSAYANGYVNLSSDQLMPSFKFRMRASNRYQVDMLETGYYYLNAPVGNVKLGTANVDAQQMPCIVKVDNVGTDDSGYRLGFDGEQIIAHNLNLYDEIGYLNSYGQVELGESRDNVTPYMLVGDTVVIRLSNINNISSYAYSISYYDENKKHIRTVMDTTISNAITAITGIGSSVKYIRISMRLKTIITKNPNAIVTINSYPITLAKLPSHRIPTTFTQGMKCGTDFGYWEGIKESNATSFRTVNTSDNWKIVEESSIENGMGIELNRIEYNNTIVEDEFDIATGKFIKRIEKVILDGINYDFEIGDNNKNPKTILVDTRKNNVTTLPKLGKAQGLVLSDQIASREGYNQSIEGIDFHSNSSGDLHFSLYKTRLGRYDKQGVVDYLQQNPLTIYYELAVPEISYIPLSSNQVKTVANTGLQCAHHNGYLNPQIKPSHLTYPVPSLVGNRTYTVVHNRKNITGSTKPIELNLGGTVVQLNDASSKTLVKTPSTLAHSNLIFIGGESTVDHIMVLDGDWTNKPIEYFENMMGHDTDAIITIIGNGQIDDVEEQYLW